MSVCPGLLRGTSQEGSMEEYLGGGLSLERSGSVSEVEAMGVGWAVWRWEGWLCGLLVAMLRHSQLV